MKLQGVLIRGADMGRAQPGPLPDTHRRYCAMANDDFTRPGADLSPWQNKDPLTLNEAAYLWAGLTPGLRKAHVLQPERFAAAQERGRQIRQAAEDGSIDYERPEVERSKNTRIPTGIDLTGWGRGSTVIQTKERCPAI